MEQLKTANALLLPAPSGSFGIVRHRSAKKQAKPHDNGSLPSSGRHTALLPTETQIV